MCGRITLHHPAGDIEVQFSLDQLLYDPKPRYNASPGQTLPVVAIQDDARSLVGMKWGLHYKGFKTLQQKKEAAAKAAAKKPGSEPKPVKASVPPINARLETVLENFAFRYAIQERRCILPADGWYEWPVFDGVKTPYRCHFKDDRLFGIPGVWEKWKDPEGEDVLTFAVITGPPSMVGGEIHNRQPMILPDEAVTSWLDTETPAEEALKLLVAEPGGLEAYPVPKEVGSYRNEGPQLIVRVEGKVFG